MSLTDLLRIWFSGVCAGVAISAFLLAILFPRIVKNEIRRATTTTLKPDAPVVYQWPLPVAGEFNQKEPMTAQEKIERYRKDLEKWCVDPQSDSNRVPEPILSNYGIKNAPEVFVAKGIRQQTLRKYGRTG